MNDRFDLHIITHHHSEAYCGYFRSLVFWEFINVSVKHIYSTKRENIDQQGYALYKDLCNETYIIQ